MTTQVSEIVAALRAASHQLAVAADALAAQPVQAEPAAAPSDLLRIHEVSELTGVPVNTLRSWRQSETGPQATRLGGRLVWDRAEVEAWIQQQFRPHAG
jgi:predicted DNA-binding transcriptional regulator AlpA